MATWDYGYAPADVVTDAAGDVRPGIELRVWDAEVAGKAVAVQQDRGDGWVLVSRVLTDDVGRYRFRTEVGPTVWVEDSSGRRWRMDAWQTLGTMIDSAQTAVTVSQAASSTADKALDTATGAAASAASAASSASAAQTAAAASATDAAASAKIATGAQVAAKMGNSFWMTGVGAPPTTFTDVANGPIAGARYRDTVSDKTWVASQVLKGEGKLTVEWEQTGPLPTIPTVQSKEQLSTLSVLEGQIVRDDSTGWEWCKTKTGWKLWAAENIRQEQTRDWYPVDRFRLDVSGGIAVCYFQTHRANGTFNITKWKDDPMFAVPRDVVPSQECIFWTINPFPDGLQVFVRLDETGMFNLRSRVDTPITDSGFIIVSGATWPVAGD
ncbi:hypothetical protein [Propionibacterium freudenreichii]|uniref:hypothetical protein n=1 Tax=Propionibacterium freudenreichii TaxID=1744 RepID=UPI0021A92D40|nr:hypothetical protein [Propionibacterium freudenreichii]MCT2990916.1 hypothetical protein [Propionibacterium freudenreichii]